MTTREPLNVEERELAARLAEWNVGVPPPAIEQAVLAHARSAQPVARATVGRRPPWLVGLASAAVLTLAVGLVWRVLESPPDDRVLMETAPMSAPVPAEPEVERASPPPVAVPAPMSPASAPPVPPVPPAPEISIPSPAAMSRVPATDAGGNAEAASPDRVTRSQVAESAPRSAAPASPPPVAAPADASPARSGASARLAPPQRGPVSAPAPVSAEPRAKAEMSVAPAEPAPRPQVLPPAPPASPAAAPVPPPLPEFVPDLHVSHERESALGQNAGDAVLGADANREDVLFNDGVERIRMLLQRGERSEALRALAQLQKRFPQRPLPADLQAVTKQRIR